MHSLRLLVASSKGGVGKSTTAVGCAAAFAGTGRNTLLIDLDFAGRSLDLLCGVEDSLMDFSDVIKGREINQCTVTPFSGVPSLRLIGACTPDRLAECSEELGMTQTQTVRKALDEIAAQDEYDVIICDTGNGLDFACAAASWAECVIIPSEQSKTSIRGAEYAAVTLEKNGAKDLKMVICSFDVAAIKREDRAGMLEMIDSSTLPCVGVLPYDESLQKYQDKGILPPGNSLTRRACRNICRRLDGYSVPLFEGLGRRFASKSTRKASL